MCALALCDAEATRTKLEHQVLKAAATGTRVSHFIGSKLLRFAATQVHCCDANQRKGAAASHLKQLHSDTPRRSDAADGTAYVPQNAARKH